MEIIEVKNKISLLLFTFSKSAVLDGKSFPINATTGLPNLSVPVLYKHLSAAISVKSSVLARFKYLSYLKNKLGVG